MDFIKVNYVIGQNNWSMFAVSAILPSLVIQPFKLTVDPFCCRFIRKVNLIDTAAPRVEATE